jgi:glycosyltransferase involved in cell wall biosynthesis
MRSFDPGYDPEMAVEVVAALRPRWPDLSMVMAGWDEGYSEDVARHAASLGVADAITFLGFCETEEKIRRMTAADIFINTNRIDNAPVILMEASAAGLVVASTDVGGIGEIVAHGSSGFLSPVGDVQAMARSVERLLSEPDLVRSMSQAARARSLAYDWSRTSPMWEALFRDCARCRTSTG